MFSNICNEKIICIRAEHSAKMAVLIEQQEMNLVTILKPEIVLRGNRWYVIHNKDLFGEGETVMKAIYDFNKQFNKTI